MSPRHTHVELFVESPLGRLRLLAPAGAEALCGLYLPGHRGMPALRAADGSGHRVLEEARRQLARYFAGERLAFDLPLRLEGTPFQQAVWAALLRIPMGEARSYGALAAEVGGGARAVGAANARNPVSIVVPCHRVVGADGRLTGYAGGEAAKRWLLAHERRLCPGPALLAP